MPTTVRIPPELLEAVDRQATRRHLTRNKYIVEALRARLEADRQTQPVPRALLDDMRRWGADGSLNELLDELDRNLKANRRSKRLVAL